MPWRSEIGLTLVSSPSQSSIARFISFLFFSLSLPLLQSDPKPLAGVECTLRFCPGNRILFHSQASHNQVLYLNLMQPAQQSLNRCLVRTTVVRSDYSRPENQLTSYPKDSRASVHLHVLLLMTLKVLAPNQVAIVRMGAVTL